ncbi:lytic transglycosylase domain-containing protein (plasmid) [Burkholderia aenigmatica]|uniref:lytic transglycosylase domain-containing protein n=1 Tax=Burkholderia aenigmatica TaxID=2015348 RepID=UPI003B42C33B
MISEKCFDLGHFALKRDEFKFIRPQRTDALTQFDYLRPGPYFRNHLFSSMIENPRKVSRGCQAMVAVAAAICVTSSAYADDLGPYTACFEDAAARYGRDPGLYAAIATVESSGCRNLVNTNKNGSRDIGCMQINSAIFPFLKRYRITEEQLLSDPCMNIHVGAWILETKIRKVGPTWEAVGAYNAGCSRLKGDACTAARQKYISKVMRAYRAQADRQGAMTAATSPAVVPRPVLRVSGD